MAEEEGAGQLRVPPNSEARETRARVCDGAGASVGDAAACVGVERTIE